ncbi:MAG: choice-of-anchor B family protein [Bacteroidetes bacterium]|nr:choice-of-anchor B family protein [Bacteroidota bacterium]
MKKILFYFFVLSFFLSKAQTYSSYKISLLSLIHPNTGTVGIGPDDRRYNGCWGWYQSSLNKEYAIVGGSSGTYFIDVTAPTSPSVSAFVPGTSNVTVREIKTYQNYCYIICDCGSGTTFKIIDMSTLPSTVTVVYDGNTLFSQGHTLWINQDKLYVGGVTYSNNTTSSMNVYSLATPAVPVLLRELKQDFPAISYVHDMLVRNDTVFASCGYQGLYVFKFNSTTNTFSQLGSYTGYSAGTYNHSSGLTQDGKHLLFCDESPAGSPIRYVDVENLNNIQPVQIFQPYTNTTPHNPFLIGNKWAVVSCYQDGLYIYDISQPGNVAVSGFFDTFPQGGGNIGNYFGQDYRGNWGAYPYLPSGIIIAADMQNGVFILDPTDAYNNPVGIKNNTIQKKEIIIYPNPANDHIAIHYNAYNASKLELKNMLGQIITEKEFTGRISENLDVSKIESGTYILSIFEKGQGSNKKLVINH